MSMLHLLSHSPIHWNRVRFIEISGRQWDLHCNSYLFIRVLGVRRVRFPSPALLLPPSFWTVYSFDWAVGILNLTTIWWATYEIWHSNCVLWSLRFFTNWWICYCCFYLRWFISFLYVHNTLCLLLSLSIIDKSSSSINGLFFKLKSICRHTSEIKKCIFHIYKLRRV